MDEKNKKVFLDTFNQHAGSIAIEPSARDAIAEAHLDTLISIRYGYFSFEDRARISEEAARRLAHLVSSEPIQPAWQKIAEDFHTNKYWGFPIQANKPKKEKKKNEILAFLWTLFQATVLMKFVILYFATNAAELNSDWHYWGLGIALAVSFSSLLFFAWRKSKTYID